MECGGLERILEYIYKYWKTEDQGIAGRSAIRDAASLHAAVALLWLEWGVLGRELGEIQIFSYSWGGWSVALPLVPI